MNILWDFRLLSTGYRDRGVGTLAVAMAREIVAQKSQFSIMIWGDRARAPAGMASWPVEWIPYHHGGWKTDFFKIPLMAYRHHIDIIHYWVALGPLHQIGLGLQCGFRSVATVCDIGVELWDGVPFLTHVKHTRYWRMQKLLARHVNRFVCATMQVRNDVAAAFTRKNEAAQLIRFPLAEVSSPYTRQREPVLIALGGSPHKNLAMVVRAFQIYRMSDPQVRLIILGDTEPGELEIGTAGDGITFDSMDKCPAYLDTASGLLFCSLHEGLGIPPLDAMAHGCPLLLSDIDVFHETCGDAAMYADPHDCNAIVRGMRELMRNNETWSLRSKNGAQHYREMSGNIGAQWIALYNSMFPELLLKPERA